LIETIVSHYLQDCHNPYGGSGGMASATANSSLSNGGPALATATVGGCYYGILVG